MHFKTTILVIASIISCICAQAGGRGRWFVAPTYGLSFVEGEPEILHGSDGFPYFVHHGTQAFSRYGVMGGYMGNWGGYARVSFAESNTNPNITLGATKRLFTFGDKYKSQLHCNLGLGYGYVYRVGHTKLLEIPDTLYPDSPLYQEVLGPRKVRENGSGWAFEGGFIYNYSHLNVGLSYALNVDFLLPSSDAEPGGKPNHTLFLSVGYAF